MNPAEDEAWQRVSPLSVLFYVGQILRGVARNFFQAVVPATVFLVSTGSTSRERLYTLAAALLVVLILVSVGRYLRFRFRVDGDALRIRQGTFRREELEIGFDRIQGISTTQNPVYRLFGLVDVKLDTAGSAASEGHLPAVASSLGDALRQRIRRRRDEATPAESAETFESRREEEQVLLTLAAGDMVRIGLTSNKGLLLLAFLAPLSDELSEYIGDEVGQLLDPLTRGLEALSPGAAAAAAFGLFAAAVLLLMGLSVAAAFLRHHRYTLTTDGEVIRSRGGLLTTHEHSMGLAKLQVMKIRSGPLLGLFGAVRIVAKQAASHALNTSKSFLIPLAPSGFPARLREVFLADEGAGLEMRPDAAAFRSISPRYVRSRTLLSGGLAVAALALLLVPRGEWIATALLVPAALLAAWLAARRRHARWGVLFTAEAAVIRQGFVGTTLSVFLLRKVQRVDVVQSPFQRRHGLVNLQFVLAAETLTVPWIDERLARRVCDYVLYRVESSRLAWL